MARGASNRRDSASAARCSKTSRIAPNRLEYVGGWSELARQVEEAEESASGKWVEAYHQLVVVFHHCCFRWPDSSYGPWIYRVTTAAPGRKSSGVLFERVVEILEQARASAVRAVNTHMVLAYWMIGREVVEELQGGEQRAEYGKAVLADLSRRLTAR